MSSSSCAISRWQRVSRMAISSPLRISTSTSPLTLAEDQSHNSFTWALGASPWPGRSLAKISPGMSSNCSTTRSSCARAGSSRPSHHCSSASSSRGAGSSAWVNAIVTTRVSPH